MLHDLETSGEKDASQHINNNNCVRSRQKEKGKDGHRKSCVCVCCCLVSIGSNVLLVVRGNQASKLHLDDHPSPTPLLKFVRDSSMHMPA